MPALAVYFVHPARMARSAACLMLSGVSKSGSPAPKSHTFAPEARNACADCMAAIVADECMRATFSETGKDDDIAGQVFMCGLSPTRRYRARFCFGSTFLACVSRSAVGR